MATPSVQVREMMGPNQFAERREIFNKYDSVFTPQNNGNHSRHSESYGRPVLLVNQDNSNGNFSRHTYSSFRDPRSNTFDYHRQRKWSDIQNPEYDDGVTVRDKIYGDLPRSHSSSDYSQNLRRQRLSKLRAEFLASNLHSPSEGTHTFERFGTRASLPAQSGTQLKGVAHIYKFPFAEPYSTPPAVKKIFLDFGTTSKTEEQQDDGKAGDMDETDSEIKEETDGIIEQSDTAPTDNVNKESVAATTPASKKRLSVTEIENAKDKFEKLRNEYAPYVPPTNIQQSLPPTKPRIINIVPKENNSTQLQAVIATPREQVGEATSSKENNAANKNSNNATKMPPTSSNLRSHQRSPSDYTKDSAAPTQNQRRNTEDNSNKNMMVPKAKKRNFFQRLFLKNKKEK